CEDGQGARDEVERDRDRDVPSPSGRLRLRLANGRCYVGNDRHSGAPSSGHENEQAPPGDPGALIVAREGVVCYLQAAGAVAASTPLHSSAFEIWPPSTASCRLSAVSGVGCRMNEATVLLPGVVNGCSVRPLTGATAGSMKPSGSLRPSNL